MQNQFYVSHDGKNHGPWSIEEVAAKINAGHLHMTDYLYDESKQDWVLFMEFSPLLDLIKGKKPKAPPKVQHHTEDEDFAAFGEKTMVAQNRDTPVEYKEEAWYVLKWENRYGPFAFVDLVKMLQDKSVFEFDYVWRQGMESWKRIAEVVDFKAEKIRALKEAGHHDLSEVFFRRRHVRSEYNGSIIIHDNKNVWKGESFEVSEGGAGIVMHNALVLPGQKVHLHFKPGDGVPPFNAACEVVSKQYVKGVKLKDAPIGYGIKFLEISGDVQKALRDFTKRAA